MGKDPKPNKTIHDLMKDIDNGLYVIPHFQRGYEWTPSMISDLLVSVLQDYFAGLLLFWELDQKAASKDKWDSLWGLSESKNPSFAILDGQQRLASLYYTIYGPPIKLPGRNSYYLFFIDLAKYLNGDFENAIRYYYTSKYLTQEEIKEKKNNWLDDGIFPLRLFSDRKFIDEKFNEWKRAYALKFVKNRSDIDELDQVRDSIGRAVSSILNYEFITHTLSAERDLSDICSIFARINQKGMKLSTFDLMNAFLYPKGIALRKLWEEEENEKFKNVDPDFNEYRVYKINVVIKTRILFVKIHILFDSRG